MAKKFQEPPAENILEENRELSYGWANWFAVLSDQILIPNLYTPTIDPASVAANTTVEQTFTVTGVSSGDYILSLVKPTLTAGIGIGGYRCSADDTVAITFINATGGAIDPGSETYTILTLSQDTPNVEVDTLGI